MVSKKQRKKYEKVGTSETDSEDGVADLESQEGLMTLNLKSPDDKIHEISLSNNCTIKDFKIKVQELTEIEPYRQRLIHFGKMLNQKPDETAMIDSGVKSGDFIHLMPLPKNTTQNNTGPNTESQSMPQVRAPGLGTEFGYLDFADNPAMEDFLNLSSAEYYQRVELGLWRARVRLISSLMLFYYFLETMGNLSLWMHPEEMDLRFEEGHHPSSLFFSIDLVEALLGVTTALAGIKASSADDTRISVLFLRNCLELCVVHFVSFAVYYREVLQGGIVLKPEFPYDHNGGQSGDDDEIMAHESLVASVVFSLAINVAVWSSILSVATRFHAQLNAIYPQGGLPAESEEEIVPETVVVNEDQTASHTQTPLPQVHIV